MNLQELLDDCLFNKKPKKKKAKSEDANIPTPQDFGALSLSRRSTKKKKDEPEKKKKETKSESADPIRKVIPKPNLFEQVSSQFAKYFWWVKKGDHYGLATFSGGKYLSDMKEVPLAGLAKAIMTDQKPDEIYREFTDRGAAYTKPILIKWLITNEEIQEAGAKDFYGFLQAQNLPMNITPDKEIVTAIQRILREPLQAIVEDPEQTEKMASEVAQKVKEFEEELLKNLKELPIDLPNKALNKTENRQVKSMFNKDKTLSNEEMKKLQEIAKKRLG